MSKIIKYNIGDKVINSKYYYFIVFENNTGCYRNQVFLKLF